ncbi:hypothetical protein GDO81_002538 [Engystomops pustulosus]|uniref:BED-type domain-containing protein n=1 Tax=Engystomops pustulosus TaxID=76066 RepID=A0AAV7DLM0_ENGPU|nr:hypothetical protein GDO81_002538 [Engystomops pustulosus]
MSQVTGTRGRALLRPEQCEQVMSWIADNASSHLSTSQSSTQSTHVTEISTLPAPPPQPPSPHETLDDRQTVVCNLCHTRISRGSTTTSLTTTSMRRHMNAKHPTQWNQGRSPPAGHTTAPSPVSSAASASQSPAQDPGPNTSHAKTTPSPPRSSTASTNVSMRSVQLSIPQTLERKRKYSATHPHAQALNVHISKLLSLEMLHYRLVETEAFRNLMAAAAPRYSVPSRHDFSRCAVPALHQHVSDNIIRALTNAVSDKVPLTTDTWMSAAGQGHYISLTAHWVNLVEPGTESDPGAGHILPTLRIAGPTSVSQAYYASSSSHPYSTSSELPSVGMAPSVGSSRHSSSAMAKRQQAVLKLLSLGDKRHTAQELLQGITAQTDLWLAPLNLKPGMVVCDNVRNLVAALQLGSVKSHSSAVPQDIPQSV